MRMYRPSRLKRWTHKAAQAALKRRLHTITNLIQDVAGIFGDEDQYFVTECDRLVARLMVMATELERRQLDGEEG